MSRLLANDWPQQSATGGFDRKGPNEACCPCEVKRPRFSNAGTVPFRVSMRGRHCISPVQNVGGARISSYMQDYPLSWNQLLEVLPDGIAFVDEHGMIRYANEHLAVLTGYTRNELVGQVVELLVPSRERDAHVAHRNEYGQDPSGREMGRGLGLTILCHDGNELEVDVALSPLALDGREWVVVMIRDDHARRAAEQVRTEFERHALATAEALSESEQRFRLAFENNVAGMVFADVDDNILAVNDAFCQLVGRTREELLGRDSTPFTFPEDLRCV